MFSIYALIVFLPVVLAGLAAVADGVLRARRGRTQWAAIAEACAGALVIIGLILTVFFPLLAGTVLVIAGLVFTAIMTIVLLIIDRPHAAPNLVLSIVALVFALLSMLLLVPVIMIAFTGMGM